LFARTAQPSEAHRVPGSLRIELTAAQSPPYTACIKGASSNSTFTVAPSRQGVYSFAGDPSLFFSVADRYAVAGQRVVFDARMKARVTRSFGNTASGARSTPDEACAFEHQHHLVNGRRCDAKYCWMSGFRWGPAMQARVEMDTLPRRAS